MENLPVLPKRSPTGHKGSYGTVLGIGGCRGMAGAVALAGHAALRGGAGLVRLAVPDPILETVAGFYPEATTIPCPADSAGRFAEQAFDLLVEQAEKSDVVFIGPGLGRSEELNRLIDRLVPRIVSDLNKPMVVDADALNAISEAGCLDIWAAPLKTCEDPAKMVLTPHPGEFARLSKSATPAEDQREQRLKVAVDFAKKYGVNLVLKGHETFITDGRQIRINTTGNPGMATGGSGDVLTGLIASLIAQRLSVFDAAILGVYLHGLAGDLAKELYGEESLLASSILESVPAAFKGLHVL